MISVCMPSYNGEVYIKDQLASILDQLSDEDEVIISDDNSSDSTVEVIRSINDKRIKLYINEANLHYIKNVENALKHSSGDVIFLSDQDDIWAPNKVQTTLAALQENDLVISDCYVTDSNLNILHESYYQLRKSKKNKFLALALGSPYLGCCLAFRRNVLLKSLPFPDYISSHDTWLGNVGAFLFKAKFIDDKLIYYRRHGGNASILAGTSKNPYWKRFVKRALIVKGLIHVS